MRAEVAHAFQVQIDGPGANDAAARQRDVSMMQAAQERPEDADRATHFTDQIVIAEAFEFRRLDVECVSVELHLRAERCQDLPHKLHVTQLRHSTNEARLRGQQGRRHDRQHGVLSAADPHFAMQRNSAFNQKTIHDTSTIVN